MSSLAMSDFTNANLYFSAFLFAISAVLLGAKFLYRWKSEAISIIIWTIANAAAALFAWLIVGDAKALLVGLGLNAFLFYFYRGLIPVISTFGVFFLISMVAPALYGLSWVLEVAKVLTFQLQPGWPLFLGIIGIVLFFALLVLINVAMLCCIAVVRFAEIYSHFPRRNSAWSWAAKTHKTFPFVSIHVPCYSEPPEMVIKTLDALAKLYYSNYEVIVLDNNTKEESLWKPVQTHCQVLGEKFRFYHLDPLKGAKAGALNAALKLTSPKAELVAIVDADYVADPDFLEKLTVFFEDPKIGFVQTCHDYRDWQHSPYLSACYYEYAMHFKLDLPAQSEWDTAYTVGTMCLLRRKALEECGGWAEWCLTEDSEIAVRLHAKGYKGYYFKDTFGRGLIPETFDSYKKQRFRWTAGPVQQFQKHWRLYLPWNHTNFLTFKQKLGETFHSLSLFFSESLFFLMTLPISAFCIWQTIFRGKVFIIPASVWVLLAAVIVRNTICNVIRNKLIKGNWQSFFYTSIAARSLLYTRLKAFYSACFKKNLAWKRTDKFKMSQSYGRAFSSSSSELALGFLYLLGIAILAPFGSFYPPDMICLTMLGMLNQALNYFCAPIMAYHSEKNLQKLAAMDGVGKGLLAVISPVLAEKKEAELESKNTEFSEK